MPEFLHIVWSVFLIVLFFGGSIFVHEYGHYLAARKRGLQVDRFSIGFGPTLWTWKDKGGVEWCVSLFPLGGYVALPQLADLEGIEGEYKTDPKSLPKISYADTLIVAVMGVVFNMIFAFALATILWGVGRPTTDSQQTTTVGSVLEKIEDTNGKEIPCPAVEAGIKPGDKILSIDGIKVFNWKDIKQFIVTSVGRGANHEPSLTLQVERAGRTLTLIVRPVLSGPEKLRSLGILPQEELYIGQIFPYSPAAKAGLKSGDQITAINGKAVMSYYDYDAAMEATGKKPLTLTVRRQTQLNKAHPTPLSSGEENNIGASPQTPASQSEASKVRDAQRLDQPQFSEITFSMTPQEVKVGKDGTKQPLLGFVIEPKTIIVYQNPVDQIVDAATLTWRTLATLVHPDSDINLTHLSGPPGIAWFIYRLSTDVRQVLSFIVLINVNLAILNLLPLPVLDGGHIALATVNRIRNKSLSPRFVAGLQNVFTVLLLCLMTYVIFFADVPRLKREWAEQQAEKKQEQNMITPDFSPEKK
jgi:regulator of sigma E protease